MLERLRAAYRVLTDQPADPARKYSATGALVVTGQVGNVQHTRWNAEQLGREGYAANVVAYLCIRLIADSFATLPFLVFRGEDEQDGHPLARLLQKPNMLRGQARFLQELAAFHLISGNSWIQAVRGRPTQPPKELVNLNPVHMKPIIGPLGAPRAYRFEANGGHIDFPIDPRTGYGDVLHLREFNPATEDSFFGHAPTRAAATWIDLDNAAAEHNNKLSRGSIPNVAFVNKGIALQEQMDAAAVRFNQRLAETRRTGDVLMMAGEWSVEKLGDTLRDMQWAEGMHESARRICAAWNVPHVLVVPGESTYANREQARLELWEHTVLPFARLLLSDLVPWLRWLYNDPTLDLRIDTDSISALEPRRETIRAGALEAFKVGALALNEYRAVLGYEAVDPSWEEADLPNALATQRLAQMGAEAQVEVARARANGEIPPAGGSFGEGGDEEEEEEEERGAKRSIELQPRVPAGHPGGGQWLSNRTLHDGNIIDWLRDGILKGALPGDLLTKAEEDDLPDWLKALLSSLAYEALSEEMKETLREMVRFFGQAAIDRVGIDLAFDVFDPSVVSFLEDFGGERIAGLVNETTRAALGKALADDVARGARYDEMVGTIRRLFASFSQYRAESIATTETTRAVGWATQHGSEVAGVERRMWLSTRDPFVRDTHRALDGQIKATRERFEASGISGMYPGSMSGGAKNNVNCRCVLIPLPDEKAADALADEEKRAGAWREHASQMDVFVDQLAADVRRGFDRQELQLVTGLARAMGAAPGA